MHRLLSGSGDMISYDDDFWAYNANGVSEDIVWSDYNLKASKCMIYGKKHLIAFELYAKNNKSCTRKKQGVYTMPVGQFALAYVAQKQQDYALQGNNYGNFDSLDYLQCAQVYYNDVYYYAKLGCTSAGGLKIISYTDDACTMESSTNLGLYNDLKISFGTCHACVTWPQQSNNNNANNANDDAAAADDYTDDDNFEYNHQFDSKLCGAADQYKESCGWGCKRMAQSSSSNNYNSKRYWSGFEKFFLCFWSFGGVGLVWVVLKQRRMMSREDAIVEEAAMQGIGLKKRHIFPIALGVIFFTILSMFMVWKKMTWIFLIGANAGLFAHFMYLRRKAK
jgi:hypothetical protein